MEKKIIVILNKKRGKECQQNAIVNSGIVWNVGRIDIGKFLFLIPCSLYVWVEPYVHVCDKYVFVQYNSNVYLFDKRNSNRSCLMYKCVQFINLFHPLKMSFFALPTFLYRIQMIPSFCSMHIHNWYARNAHFSFSILTFVFFFLFFFLLMQKFLNAFLHLFFHLAPLLSFVWHLVYR